MPNRSILLLQFAALLVLVLALFMGRKERRHTVIRIWQGFFLASLILGLIGSLDLGGFLTLIVNVLGLLFAVVAIGAAVVALKQ